MGWGRLASVAGWRVVWDGKGGAYDKRVLADAIRHRAPTRWPLLAMPSRQQVNRGQRVVRSWTV